MINAPKKTIVCYGDSNTWGAIPSSELRYGRDMRWPSVLQQLAGDGYEIISEGLSGRTLKSDKALPEKNGIAYILPCVLSHEPLEWVVIMLGTNDVKDAYGLSAADIAANLKETISIIRKAEIENKENLKILIICPPQIVEPEKGPDPRFKEGIEKSRQLPALYKNIAAETKSFFLNANDYIVSSKIDGIHFDSEEQKKLAVAVWSVIKTA